MNAENSSNNNSIPEIKNNNENIKNSLLIPETLDAEAVILAKKKKKLIIIISSISLILLLLCSFLIYKYYNKKQYSDNIIYIPQPLSERSTFRYYTLPNDIKVLLISPNATTTSLIPKTQIALTVGVGSQSDPKAYSGLTHLYEHLLFTGTQKYSGTYMDTVIDEYKGLQNGETNDFSTSFYFEIDDKGVGVVLTVLADAVSNAVFSKETVKAEVNNINSEVTDKMTSNRSMNYYRFVKSQGDRKSMMFNDGWELFGDEIDYNMLTEELEAFHQQYYSSNIMSLVVITNEDVDKVKEMIEEEIGSIQDLGISRPFFEQIIPTRYPFSGSVLGSVFYLKKETDVSSLTLFFTLVSDMKIESFDPISVFTYLIEYQAKGAFKNKLMDMNLISSLELEVVFKDIKNQVFAISFDVKEENQDVRKIIMEFFSFIEFLKSLKEDFDKIYKKMQLFSKFDFIFNIDSDNFKFFHTSNNLMERAKRFSEIILETEPNYVFTENNILYDYDAKKWEDFLGSMKIQNSFILYESKIFKENLEEDDENKIPIIEIDENKKSDEEETPKKSEIEDDKKTDKTPEERLIKKKKDLKLKMRRVVRILEEKNDKKEKVDENKQKVNENKEKNDENNKKEKDDENKENEEIEEKEESSDSNSNENEEEVEDKYKTMEIIKELDLKAEEIELTRRTKFDRNISYDHYKFSEKLIKNFYHKLNKNNTYELMDINFDILNKYDMNDTCDGPNFEETRRLIRRRILAEDSSEKKKSKTKSSEKKKSGSKKSKSAQSSSKEESFSEEKNTEKEKSSSKESNEKSEKKLSKDKIALNTEKLIENIFIFETPLSPESEKIINSIYDYKTCLTNEFFEDSLTIVPTSIKSENKISVYYKNQRVSFQPKVTIYIEIGQEDLFDKFLYASYKERINILVNYHIFCEYIEDHIIDTFPNEFLQGDKFNCYLSDDHVNLIIYIETLTNKIGIEKKYFDELKKFEDPKMFDEFKLNNIKIKALNSYSDYSSFSSLDIALYKLNNILDPNSINRQEGKELDYIKSIILENENRKEFSEIAKKIFIYSEFNVVIIGNYEKAKSWELGLELEKHFKHKEFDSGMDRKMLLSKLINKPSHGTSVLRLQNSIKDDKNNVYITYFFVGVLSKTMRIALRVLVYYLDIHVFRVLRTNLNLGYVAGADLNDYFEREGIVITLQGINFEPHLVEKTVNKMIIDFLELMGDKTDSEINSVAKQEFGRIMNLKGDIDVISEKVFDNYQILMNNGEKSSYHLALNKFKPNMVLSLAEKIFRDKKYQRRYVIEIFENLNDDIMEYKMNNKYGIIPGKDYVIKEYKDFFAKMKKKGDTGE